MKKETYQTDDQLTFDSLLGLPPKKEDDDHQTTAKRPSEVMFNDAGKPINMANGYSSADVEEIARIQRGEDEESSI